MSSPERVGNHEKPQDFVVEEKLPDSSLETSADTNNSQGLMTPRKLVGRIEKNFETANRDSEQYEISAISTSQRLKNELATVFSNQEKDQTLENDQRQASNPELLRNEVINNITNDSLPALEKSIAQNSRILRLIEKMKQNPNFSSDEDFISRVESLGSILSNSAVFEEARRLLTAEAEALQSGEIQKFLELFEQEKLLLKNIQFNLKELNLNVNLDSLNSKSNLKSKIDWIIHEVISGPLFVMALMAYTFKPRGETMQQKDERMDEILGWLNRMAPNDAELYYNNLPNNEKIAVVGRLDELGEQPYDFIKKETDSSKQVYPKTETA